MLPLFLPLSLSQAAAEERTQRQINPRQPRVAVAVAAQRRSEGRPTSQSERREACVI